jgi:geranylgeranyl diphosphate synthase type 3
MYTCAHPLLLDVLRQRPTDIELKTYAVNYMDSQTHSFEYTRQVLEKLDEQAREEIARLGGNPGLTVFLDRMKMIRLSTPSSSQGSAEPSNL